MNKILEHRKCTVYGLVSSESPNLVRYIGQTTGLLKERLRGHIKGKNPKLPVKKWIDKHHAIGNEIKIIPICIGSWNETEIDCIRQAKLKGWQLLNASDGGGGMLGVIPSEEWRLKQSAAHKGRIKTERERNKLSLANKGKHHSEEAKRKMSEAKKGKKIANRKPVSDETKEKIRLSKLGNKNRLGKKHTEETKKKIAENKLVKKIHSEEWKNKFSELMKGNQFGKGHSANKGSFKTGLVPWNKEKKHSEETIKKISSSKKGNCFFTDEQKKQHSERMIAWWKERKKL